MPPRKTPRSWGTKLTPAQRQAARRERLKAERVNKVLNAEGKAVDKFKTKDDYLVSRKAELKAIWPLWDDAKIEELARDFPPHVTLGPPPSHEEAVRSHQKLIDKMAAEKAKREAGLAAYKAREAIDAPQRESRRNLEVAFLGEATKIGLRGRAGYEWVRNKMREAGY